MSPTTQSTSAFVLAAAKIAPAVTQPAKQAGHCDLCCAPYRPGDGVVVWTAPEQSFTDYADLPESLTGNICSWCARAMDASVLRKFGAFLATRDSVVSIASDAARVWLLENTPQPPFVVAVGTTTSQHLVWRTPITYSRNLWTVRVGRQLVTVDRDLVLEARAAIRGMERHPWRTLDRALKTMAHGLPNDEVAVSDDMQRLMPYLGPGELWMLASVAKASPPEAVAPDPIKLQPEDIDS